LKILVKYFVSLPICVNVEI